MKDALNSVRRRRPAGHNARVPVRPDRPVRATAEQQAGRSTRARQRGAGRARRFSPTSRAGRTRSSRFRPPRPPPPSRPRRLSRRRPPQGSRRSRTGSATGRSRRRSSCASRAETSTRSTPRRALEARTRSSRPPGGSTAAAAPRRTGRPPSRATSPPRSGPIPARALGLRAVARAPSRTPSRRRTTWPTGRDRSRLEIAPSPDCVRRLSRNDGYTVGIRQSSCSAAGAASLGANSRTRALRVPPGSTSALVAPERSGRLDQAVRQGGPGRPAELVGRQ